MADARCVGEGAGWGTIEGARLRVLILADAARIDVARAIARAVAQRHEPTLFDQHGFFASLHAARAARETKPHLIHAIGRDRAAKLAPVIAKGIGVPFVLSLTAADLEEGRHTRALLDRVREAAAVMLDGGPLADALRSRGIERDLYVLSTPAAAEEDAAYLGALEVVYGRVVAGGEIELEPNLEPNVEGPPAEAGARLVQIGRKKP